MSAFEFIESHQGEFRLDVFYNRQRRHSTLGYKTPVEFEQSRAHEAA